jgi:5-methylcytosine-specific restriction endonuclease McrA
MSAFHIPSSDEQLKFLANIQRLFNEGDFTATYKFALLIALSDIAVELGTDDGREMDIKNKDLGERFIELYWRQTLPFGTGRPDAVPGTLVQNKGVQAAVVSAIVDFRGKWGCSIYQSARALPAYGALLNTVTQTVAAQPLNYLQNFGGTKIAFLYERDRPGWVRLKPGVSYCLRRFHPLVQRLARSHWLEHIKANRRNRGILGDTDDLENFLFSASRQSLLLMAEGLRKIDGTNCFYCGGAVMSAQVDHFFPFSHYPRDLAHNLVLAHASCNRSKSATLAARKHLEHWLERMERRVDAISEIGYVAGLIADATVSRKVAAWGYTSAITSGGSAWIAPAIYEPIDLSYARCFDDGSATMSRSTLGIKNSERSTL